MLSRLLTARDRAPKKGDVLRLGRTCIEVREEPTKYCPYLVYDGRGLTRMGLWWLRGIPTEDAGGWWEVRDGWPYWTDDGHSLSPARAPFVYVARADGGVLDVPTDCEGRRVDSEHRARVLEFLRINEGRLL